jgi:hypothetical protein
VADTQKIEEAENAVLDAVIQSTASETRAEKLHDLAQAIAIIKGTPRH